MGDPCRRRNLYHGIHHDLGVGHIKWLNILVAVRPVLYGLHMQYIGHFIWSDRSTLHAEEGPHNSPSQETDLVATSIHSSSLAVLLGLGCCMFGLVAAIQDCSVVSCGSCISLNMPWTSNHRLLLTWPFWWWDNFTLYPQVSVVSLFCALPTWIILVNRGWVTEVKEELSAVEHELFCDSSVLSSLMLYRTIWNPGWCNIKIYPKTVFIFLS